MLDEEDRGRITYPVRHIRIGLVLLHPQTLLGRQEDSGVAPWNPQSSHMLHGEGVGVWGSVPQIVEQCWVSVLGDKGLA